MTKIFNIHALPQGKVGFEKGDLCKRIVESKVFDEKVGHLMIATTTKTFPNPDWQAHYSYITHPNPEYNFVGYAIADSKVYFIDGLYWQSDDKNFVNPKKVIFTNDPKYNLHGIPQSLVKAYADANGEMKEVDLEMEPCCEMVCDGTCERYGTIAPKIIENCCVWNEKDKTVSEQLKEHLDSITPEQFKKESEEIQDMHEPQPIQVEPEEQVDYTDSLHYKKGLKLFLELLPKVSKTPVSENDLINAEFCYQEGYGAKWREEHSKETDAAGFDFAEWYHKYKMQVKDKDDRMAKQLHQLFKSKQK